MLMAMNMRPTQLRVPSAAALLVALLAVGCAPSYNYEPMVRQPVPTLSDELWGAEKGTVVVRRGDSIYAIARRHGVAVRGLIDANRLAEPYVIHPGQRLQLPQPRFHVVAGDETVYAISRRYNVDMGSLVRVNEIPPPYRIERGQRLRLPDGAAMPDNAAEPMVVASAQPDAVAVAPIAPEAAPVIVPTSLPEVASLPDPAWSRPDPEPLKSPPPRSGQKFLWPVRGKVIAAFGARKGGLHNDGINIAAGKGAEIRATENGVVAYAGNQLQGFGNLVLVKHDDGWMSAYAHASILLVKRGDLVRRGQVIARVGRTGSVSTPQLHFELRRGERAVDPQRYLVRFASVEKGRRVTSTAFPDDRPDPG